MCWSCNPYCGGCKPPKPKPVKCAICNGYTFAELKNCKRCGAPLPELAKPAPVFCLFVGKVCANPCRKHKKAPLDDAENSCAWHSEPTEDETK